MHFSIANVESHLLVISGAEVGAAGLASQFKKARLFFLPLEASKETGLPAHGNSRAETQLSFSSPLATTTSGPSTLCSQITAGRTDTDSSPLCREQGQQNTACDKQHPQDITCGLAQRVGRGRVSEVAEQGKPKNLIILPDASPSFYPYPNFPRVPQI